MSYSAKTKRDGRTDRQTDRQTDGQGGVAGAPTAPAGDKKEGGGGRTRPILDFLVHIYPLIYINLHVKYVKQSDEEPFELK